MVQSRSTMVWPFCEARRSFRGLHLSTKLLLMLFVLTALSIGSLFLFYAYNERLLVQEVMEGQQVQGNMFVPIDLLEPILNDLLTMGQANRPARPWLGMYATEANGQLVVAGLAKGAPAERAGVQPGDVVVEVAGERASGLADLFRKVWRLGSAGVEVPLTLARDGTLMRARVRSADRGEYLKKPRMH